MCLTSHAPSAPALRTDLNPLPLPPGRLSARTSSRMAAYHGADAYKHYTNKLRDGRR